MSLCPHDRGFYSEQFLDFCGGGPRRYIYYYCSTCYEQIGNLYLYYTDDEFLELYQIRNHLPHPEDKTTPLCNSMDGAPTNEHETNCHKCIILVDDGKWSGVRELLGEADE